MVPASFAFGREGGIVGATIAAALKKIAVYVLSNKKGRKIVCGIVLGIVVIVVMPIAVVLSIFSGGIDINTDGLHEMMSTQQEAVDDVWSSIEQELTDAGYTTLRIKEAEVLCAYMLYDKAAEDGFSDKLIGCFAPEQTDEAFIAAVNEAFGTDFAVNEFTDIMQSIRRSYIACDDYTDPDTKNNLDLVKWALHAHQAGWGYVWGTYGEVLDENLLAYKKTQYPEQVGADAEYIADTWLDGRTSDCVGLIKGYGWFDPKTNEIVYAANDMPDIGADAMYNNAAEKGEIDTIPEIPGLAVWHEGHIGIYIGDGEVIHAANTHDGVIRNAIEDVGWTHWLKIPYITYAEEAEIES